MKHAALIPGQNGRLTRGAQKDEGLTTVARMNNFLRGVEQRAFITARLATQNEDEALDIVQDAMCKLA